MPQNIQGDTERNDSDKKRLVCGTEYLTDNRKRKNSSKDAERVQKRKGAKNEHSPVRPHSKCGEVEDSIEQDVHVEVSKLEDLKNYLDAIQLQIDEKEEELRSLKQTQARLGYLVERTRPI